MSHYSRRKFIGSLPCLAVGTSTLYSSLINLKTMSGILSSSPMEEDYKALVCVLLGGGNDSYNMLVPRSNAEYNEYAQVRSNQSIPKEDLLPINPVDGDGREYGLHPSMRGVKALFDKGQAAFVTNVGTLIEPVDKSGVINNSAKLPLGLLSHSDQVMHWQTAFPQDRSSKGWGGKVADIMQSMNQDNGVSMNISLGGNNIFQFGNEVVPYSINNDGGVAIVGWEFRNTTPFFNVMAEDINDSLNKEYEDLFKKSYAGTMKQSIDSNEIFNAAIAANNPLMTAFSGDGLSQDFRMIADTIASREQLGAKRQIFFVQLGGFDNHDELITNHGNLLSRLDGALTSFYEAMDEIGMTDQVTTYTISDFSRTLTSNGNGTDHAWGGNAMVLGGAVNGNKMYGEYPSLELGNNLEIGGGVLIPTTSADEYFAELALWFGISPNDLSLVLPNLNNFYSYDPNQRPLGFLG